MIERKDVEYIAQLARLNLTSEEIESFTQQLGSILGYVEELKKLDTEQVEPTCFFSPEHDPLRDDNDRPSLTQDEVLQNAPLAKKGFFAIPKVIG
ncbi:MAG: Asp-tRNA(Asn)/Glu-tRNA(Gln) amidotransferase subunit GatC [Fibrobacterota bacterium]